MRLAWGGLPVPSAKFRLSSDGAAMGSNVALGSATFEPFWRERLIFSVSTTLSLSSQVPDSWPEGQEDAYPFPERVHTSAVTGQAGELAASKAQQQDGVHVRWRTT